MPRRRISRVSISSEHSTNSDHSDNLNVTDDLPDPGLPKTNCKDAKEKKKVSFNFPLEVITQTGKYTGIGTIDLLDTLASLEHSAKVRKTKAELKEVLSQFNFEGLTNEEMQLISPKNKGGQRNQRKPAVGELTSKKEAAKEVREAKEAKKKEIEAKREAVKKAIENKKAAKVEFEENNKLYKPGECLKYITIEMHPALASAWYMADSVREVTELGARVVAADTICDPGLLTWTRRVPPTLTTETGQVAVSGTRRCARALCVVPAARVAELAQEGRCATHLGEVRARAGTPLSLLVLGASGYYRNLPRGNGAQRMTREKFTKTIIDLQIGLLVSHKMELFVVETPMELASLVVHFTRAIAEAPYKKAKRDIDEQAEFYMRGDNKNCVTVDTHGNGLSRLWEQMIAVLPQSSLEVARTLGSEYKNPSALLQEFETAGGTAKIADIGVARTNVPGAKTRRMGPEFARKLHTLFTTEDGNTVIE